MIEHPAYDAFWQGQALDKLMAAQPLAGADDVDAGTVGPGGHVGRDPQLPRVEAEGHGNDQNYLVMGPWRHSQVNYDGYDAGPAEVGRRHRAAVPPRRAEAVLRSVPEGRRAEGRHAAGVHLQHRRESLGPAEALAARLRDGLRRADEAALSAAGFRPGLRQAAGARAGAAPTTYVSDPAKPVPYCRGPCASPMASAGGSWLVTDQRLVADRTDVLTYADARC